jgi:hypothetical protein
VKAIPTWLHSAVTSNIPDLELGWVRKGLEAVCSDPEKVIEE